MSRRHATLSLPSARTQADDVQPLPVIRIVISTDPAAEIVFQMLAGTHQVYQTSFDAPCTPLSGGFSTDTVTRPAGEDASAASPTFSFTPSDVSSVL